VVNACCSYLERHLDQQGIFRIPGAQSAVERIFASFENPVEIHLEAEENPHNVAGAFKLLLRSYEESPVLPFDLHDEVVRIGSLARSDSAIAIQEARVLVGGMAADNLRVLDRVCTLLRLTAAQADANKMDITNLAIVFGPTLIRMHPSKETPMALMSVGDNQRQFVELLLRHYSEIVSGVNIPN